MDVIDAVREKSKTWLLPAPDPQLCKVCPFDLNCDQDWGLRWEKKVAFKVTTAANSMIILDTTGAEYLIGHGDMLVGGSIPLQRLQGPLVTRTEIEMAMQISA